MCAVSGLDSRCGLVGGINIRYAGSLIGETPQIKVHLRTVIRVCLIMPLLRGVILCRACQRQDQISAAVDFRYIGSPVGYIVIDHRLRQIVSFLHSRNGDFDILASITVHIEDQLRPVQVVFLKSRYRYRTDQMISRIIIPIDSHPVRIRIQWCAAGIEIFSGSAVLDARLPEEAVCFKDCRLQPLQLVLIKYCLCACSQVDFRRIVQLLHIEPSPAVLCARPWSAFLIHGDSLIIYTRHIYGRILIIREYLIISSTDGPA